MKMHGRTRSKLIVVRTPLATNAPSETMLTLYISPHSSRYNVQEYTIVGTDLFYSKSNE